jgi:hypothetical protein
MDNYIIKGTGTIDEICTALKTMQAVFGKEARLTEIATATRYGRIKTAVRKQFDEGEGKK